MKRGSVSTVQIFDVKIACAELGHRSQISKNVSAGAVMQKNCHASGCAIDGLNASREIDTCLFQAIECDLA